MIETAAGNDRKCARCGADEWRQDGYCSVECRDLHEVEHIADVIVTPGAGYTITEETVAIASAIYWSWWRARDMHGEAP